MGVRTCQRERCEQSLNRCTAENAEKGEAKLHRRDAQSADANLGGLFALASTAEQKHVNSYGQGNQSDGGQ
jgi:hypothetical protein